MPQTPEEVIQAVRACTDRDRLLRPYLLFFGLFCAIRYAYDGFDWMDLDAVSDIIQRIHAETDPMRKKGLLEEYQKLGAEMFDPAMSTSSLYMNFRAEIERGVGEVYAKRARDLISEGSRFYQTMDEDLKEAALVGKDVIRFRGMLREAVTKSEKTALYLLMDQVEADLPKIADEKREIWMDLDRRLRALKGRGAPKAELDALERELQKVQAERDLIYERNKIHAFQAVFAYMRDHRSDVLDRFRTRKDKQFIRLVDEIGADTIIEEFRRYDAILDVLEDAGRKLAGIVREQMLAASDVTQEDAERWFEKSVTVSQKLRKAYEADGTYESFRNDCLEYYRLVNGKVGGITFNLVRARDNRSFYRHSDRSISLCGDYTKKTLFHELSHASDGTDGIDSAELCFQFIRGRAEQEKTVKLKTLTGVGYGRDEVAFKDSFVHPYVGKVYSERRAAGGHLATEVFSMGMETLADPKEMIRLASYDREHLALTLALATRKKPEPETT